MNVIAIFKLPVHVWVTTDTLADTFPSGSGDVRFTVATPREEPPIGAPPAIDGIDLPESAEVVQTEWAQEYAAHIPASLKPATALVRVVITDVEAPEDLVNTWRTADQQLADAIDIWFDKVRTWAEVITGQDLDPNHRVFDVKIYGDGLSFIVPPHDGAKGMSIGTSRVLPLRAEEWRFVLAAVRDGKEPPLEETLTRDARAANLRGSYRRATIEAAVAVEVVLARIVTKRANELPERQRRRLERPMLGTLIDVADQLGFEFAVTFEELRRLSNARNDAVHRGLAPNSRDTSKLVQLAMNFIGAHGLYRRTGKREPDGSDLTFADPDDDTTG